MLVKPLVIASFALLSIAVEPAEASKPSYYNCLEGGIIARCGESCTAAERAFWTKEYNLLGMPATPGVNNFDRYKLSQGYKDCQAYGTDVDGWPTLEVTISIAAHSALCPR